MICPNCKVVVTRSKVDRLPAVSELHARTVKCVSYCCEKCGAILGVESDPLERDAQMDKIKSDVAQLTKDMEIVLKKLTSFSASIRDLKKP